MIKLFSWLFAVLLSAFSPFTTYTASYTMYVSAFGDVSATETVSELVSAKALAQTCVAILTDRATLETVAANTELSVSADELAKTVLVEVIQDSALIKISVTAKNSKKANAIAETFNEVLQEKTQGLGYRVLMVGEITVKKNKGTKLFG